MLFNFLRWLRSFTVFSPLIRFKSRTSKTMQVFIQKRNPITGSTEWDVQHEDYDYHQEIARSAFADMLHDMERNEKYYRALHLAIKKMHDRGKKANVLDIGTGTGLLAIMAAKWRADSIVACEAFKPMAECCNKVLERNGVLDKITVIPKRSTDLTVGENGDMKEKANILVTEVFDTELIGEGALSTFSHAHKYLLEEDCIVVPDSAVIYAQVVECPTLQKWNKLNDLVDEDLDTILTTPQKIKDCAGSAAVHDIQLSQLPRDQFIELSENIPVFYYDWSGKTPINLKRTVKQDFTVTNDGKAQMVFMWWELNMDPEGTIVLSCAPWWSHPDTAVWFIRPQDTIPWRDHWMQGVYYLPKEVTLKKYTEATLVSCQDEYSLWFYLEDDKTKYENFQRPICECGVHMTMSRTHVSRLNDDSRNKKLLEQLKLELAQEAVVLDLNGSSLLGLASANLGAKRVYILEDMNLNIGILKDYIEENGLENVKIVPDVSDEILNEVTNVTCDPNFSTAVLPWENLKVAYLLNKYGSKIREFVTVIPECCEFWAMPVELQNLHKIRIPVNSCGGIDMTAFDDLVQNSREISDAEIEPQPLWEYPCKSRGPPRRLLEIDLRHLTQTLAADGTNPVMDVSVVENQPMNAFVLWARWKVGGNWVSCGPTEWPEHGSIVAWDPHTRQAVKILLSSTYYETVELTVNDGISEPIRFEGLQETNLPAALFMGCDARDHLRLEKIYKVNENDKWCYQVVADFEKGQFNITIDLVHED